MEKLESDIQELAQKCVTAMKRAKKNKPKSNFQKLLEDAVGDDDDDFSQDYECQDDDSADNQDKDDDDQNSFEMKEREKELGQMLLMDAAAARGDDNTSNNAEDGNRSPTELNEDEKGLSIKGEELSYEDLFKKNKSRKRGDRHSYAPNSGQNSLQNEAGG